MFVKVSMIKIIFFFSTVHFSFQMFYLYHGPVLSQHRKFDKNGEKYRILDRLVHV